MSHFLCVQCSQEKPYPAGYGSSGYSGPTGYATNDNDEKICYDCCAVNDLAYMNKEGKISLYLDRRRWEITNWPGTLRFRAINIRKGNHNIAKTRYDAWFYDQEGNLWHGVLYGEWTQIIHCRRTKVTLSVIAYDCITGV